MRMGTGLQRHEIFIHSFYGIHGTKRSITQCADICTAVCAGLRCQLMNARQLPSFAHRTPPASSLTTFPESPTPLVPAFSRLLVLPLVHLHHQHAAECSGLPTWLELLQAVLHLRTKRVQIEVIGIWCKDWPVINFTSHRFHSSGLISAGDFNYLSSCSTHWMLRTSKHAALPLQLRLNKGSNILQHQIDRLSTLGLSL